MSALTDKQVKLLDDLGKGPKGIRELLDDHGVTWREFTAWQGDAAFAQALEEVFRWLAFVREADVRVGATEALRKQRETLHNRNFYLSARQRQVGEAMWNKARQLDGRFPRQWGPIGTRKEISPLHPDHVKEARQIVQRMEELRRAALEARAREKAATALPAPSTTATPATE